MNKNEFNIVTKTPQNRSAFNKHVTKTPQNQINFQWTRDLNVTKSNYSKKISDKNATKSVISNRHVTRMLSEHDEDKKGRAIDWWCIIFITGFCHRVFNKSLHEQVSENNILPLLCWNVNQSSINH